MKKILELFGIVDLTPAMENRLVLSAFSLLIFFILIYFYVISREKIKANHKDGSGLVYTFNWINELNFYELSNIWVNENESDETHEEAYSKLTIGSGRDDWKEKIASDKLEKVIEEVIIYKKHKNESLEAILNIASRNTRNNNNRLMDMISYEEYQLNRNKVSHSLMSII